MASSRLKTTKDGRQFFEIRVSRGREKSYLSRRWYVPDGWSAKAIQRELAKVSAEFERQVHAGEIVSRAERKALETEAQRLAAIEKAKIQTLREYITDVYLPAKAITSAENTMTSLRFNLEKCVIPVLGEVPVKDVEPAMLRKLLLNFQENHSYGSTNLLRTVLIGLFKSAVLDGITEKNPMDNVPPVKRKKSDVAADESSKAYTAEQMANIFQCLKNEPLFWQTYVCLMADGGLRRGECCGLQWEDVDWASRTVRISRTLEYSGAAGIYQNSPKNGKSRCVDIGEDTLRLLNELRVEQSKTCISKWVFTQTGSPEPRSPQLVTKFFRKFGEKYNIPDLHPHKLRHTSATLSILNGADVVSVSKRLGHSSPSITTNVYAHANQEAIRAAGDAARNALKMAK